MRVTGNKQRITRVSMGRLLVIWREFHWNFDDKQELYRAFLDNQAQKNVTLLLDLLKRESVAADERTWLADLAYLLLTWMEGGQTALRLFLFSDLQQNANSKALSRLHALLARYVRTRLAVLYTDELECALSARCFVDLIFHFGLMRTMEGKWPSAAALDQVVQTIVRMVVSNSASETLPRVARPKSEDNSMASTPRLPFAVRGGEESMRYRDMNNKQNQKEQQTTRLPEKEETPFHWELTDDDKAFLKACNISSK